ncbi:MAG: hypothetical protein OXC60_08290 [Litoreibacter sp.]|nr:hypothetical protein [Litoreibacter sp.]
MKAAIVVSAALVLAGCGGSGNSTSRGAPSVGLATGPISAACNRSDRRAANPRICGCAQTMADRHLSANDQRKAASFFADPQRAQDTRQSDRRSDELFWDRYKVFVASSERYCAAIR